jgi:hypothetical protein
MLPVPKIDFPTRIDSASDGLGLFFFSRKVYVLCALTVLFYAVLIWTLTIFSFVFAFILGLLALLVFSVTVKQPT